MAEHFSFFDAVLQDDGTYDREYNAQQFTKYFGALVTTGVMKGTGNMLAVSANGSNMVTKIDTGIGFVEAKYYENDSFLELTHDTETLGKDRVDRIVVRMDLSTEARYVKAFIKKGAPSTNPVAPPLTQTPNLYEISLAQVKIVGGQTFIATNAVTDERGKDNICPWAGSKILPNFDNDALQELIDSQLTDGKFLKVYNGHPNDLLDTGFYHIKGATTAGGYPLSVGAGSSLLEVFAIAGEDTVIQRFTFASTSKVYSYVRSKRNSTVWNGWYVDFDISSKADVALTPSIAVSPLANWKGSINVTKDNFGMVFMDFMLTGGTKTAGITFGNIPNGYRPPTGMAYFEITECNINGQAVATNQGFMSGGDLVNSVAINASAYSIMGRAFWRTT